MLTPCQQLRHNVYATHRNYSLFIHSQRCVCVSMAIQGNEHSHWTGRTAVITENNCSYTAAATSTHSRVATTGRIWDRGFVVYQNCLFASCMI